MPKQSRNPFNFWQELKRRKVFRVIVMYAGAAYVIIELVNNVAEPLHLPEWTATLVILLLIIGFPVVALLSWFFDITPQGIEKTPYSTEPSLDQLSLKRKRLRVSDIIIALLLIIIIILVYPKVFDRDKSIGSMTIPITFINEFGEKETNQIFKKEFIHNIHF